MPSRAKDYLAKQLKRSEKHHTNIIFSIDPYFGSIFGLQ